METIAKDAYCCAQQGKENSSEERFGRVSLWYLGSGGRQGRPGLGPSRAFPYAQSRWHHYRMREVLKSHPMMFSVGLPQCQMLFLIGMLWVAESATGQRTKRSLGIAKAD